MRLSQTGRAKDTVKTSWLEEVKRYGAKPIKLLYTINIKSDVGKSREKVDFLIKGLNSVKMYLVAA